MISFNRFNGTKEDFELYKSSLGLSDEDIVFISDNATNKFIYANGTYFGSTEIYEGTSEPKDLSVKLWLDTNEPTALKYKNSKEEWETISTGGSESSENTKIFNVYVGAGLTQEQITENIKTYRAIQNEEAGIYTLVDIDNSAVTVASLTSFVGDIALLTLQTSGPGDESNNTYAHTLINIKVTSDGKASVHGYQTYNLPTTPKVETMIEEASVEVINSLDSDSTTAALSAKQGKALKALIDNLPTGDSAGVKRYQVFSTPTEEQLPLNKAAYEAVMNDEDAIFYIETGGGILYSNMYLKSTPVAMIAFQVVTPITVNYVVEGCEYTQIVLSIDSNGNVLESPISNLSGTIPSTEKVQSLIDTAIEGITPGGEGSSSPEIYIGDEQPSDDSDVVVWYDTNGADEPDEPTTTTVTWEDIEDKPDFAKVATTGDYNDLINKPSFEGGEVVETCTVYAVYDGEDPKAHMTNEWALSNKDAFIKIENSRKNGTPLNINIVVPFYDGTEVLYEDCYVVGGGEYSYTLQSATVVKDVSNPYISYVEISTFTNGFKYYEEGQSIPGCYADIYKTSLATDSELLRHTTTHIGADTPTNSKYNLWVDTSKEEVVFKYKDANNTWQVLSTGGNGSIEVDTELNETSENPIANKAVYELATVIGKDFETINQDISKKANTENGLVEGRGFKVTDYLKYYLPNTIAPIDPPVDDTHILATKADTLSNEVIDSKATVYNLYAMDELTDEQLAANEAALVSVQNREVAIYKVYTDDDTYAIADVKIVDGPYLEAYVYVNTPNTTDKQATITRYKYSFNQAGEYLPSDKDIEEVIVPSIAKVNELIGSGGTGGGLELRELKMSGSADDNAYNLETLELMRENKVLPAVKPFGDVLTPALCLTEDIFLVRFFVEGFDAELLYSVESDGSVHQTTEIINGCHVITTAADFLAWKNSNDALTQGKKRTPAYIFREGFYCLVDSTRPTDTNGGMGLQFNADGKRYERVYSKAGDMTSETEIPLGSGGGGGSITLDSEMSADSENAVQNKVVKAYVDGLVGDVNSLLDNINGEEV